MFENYTSAPVSRQQQYQGYEHHAPSQQQGPQQPFYRSVPQMPNSYPSQQQYMQQQQAVQQPQTYYHQVSAPQQQHFAAPDLSFAQQAPAAPQFAPQAAAQQQVFGATPSFETPQGTFYFVPNPNAPVSMGMPMPMPLSLAAAANGAMQQLGQLGQQPPQHARTISTGSWDGDLDDKPRLQPVKKGGKGKKNQTKRFVSRDPRVRPTHRLLTTVTFPRTDLYPRWMRTRLRSQLQPPVARQVSPRYPRLCVWLLRSPPAALVLFR